MNKKKNYGKGVRREITALALMCGCLPMKRLQLLDVNHRTLLNKIREMQSENVLDEYKDKGKWLFGFRNFEKNLPAFEDAFAPELIQHYRIYGKEDAKKAKYRSNVAEHKNDDKRVIDNITSLLFFYGIRINCLVSDKPNLRCNTLEGIRNSFYTSREIKGYKNLQGDKGKNNAVETTRLSGLCITHGGNYVVFQMGKSILVFSERGEGKAKIYLEHLLFEKKLGGIDGNILLADKESCLKSLIDPPSKKAEQKLAGIFDTYETVYLLTNDKQGQKMMEIMAMQDWEDIIYAATLSKEQRSARSTTSIDCDGYKDGVHYMVYCIPNIARLKRFYGAARLMRNKEKYIVYCYNHQEALLRDIVGEYCIVQSADFNQLYDYMKGEKK